MELTGNEQPMSVRPVNSPPGQDPLMKSKDSGHYGTSQQPWHTSVFLEENSPHENGLQHSSGSQNRDRQNGPQHFSKPQHRDHDDALPKHHPGSTLSYHNISYQVKVSDKGCCKGSHKKKILHDVNGLCKPGMNAILGPTGSGKTSLLDVLSGRKDPNGLSGTILMDGNPVPDNFKCMVGYVVQDDVVMGTLTVRENFYFSATLRLPKSYSSSDRKSRVEETIQELGLTTCADNKIGNEFIRGVSGGERKRTNIGMELIIAPPILFLDEPTTGLDASTANAVMLLLKRLTLKGKTVIFSIHQPRYSIYRLFDSMMLLSMGETVYHGPSSEALTYFSSIGHECEEHNNPPDFFLDIINGDSTAVISAADDDQLQGILNKVSSKKKKVPTATLR